MKKYLPLFITILFFAMTVRLIGKDYYYDEVYSLVHSILVPFKQTSLVYNSLNNHVLYSLLMNGYTKLIGIDLGGLMGRPYIIRVPQLIFLGVTIFYLYRIGKKYFNERIALYSIVLLMTTVPYYYYVTQIRGYSLSIMLMTMLTYYLWRK